MDKLLPIAMAAVDTNSAALGAFAAKSKRVTTRWTAYAAIASHGGNYPEWLPQAPSGDRPLVYADFKNGNYWANNGTRTSAIFVQNLNWGPYDPACIIPGSGLLSTASKNSPTVDPAYLGSALSGCTIVGVMAIVGDPSTAAISLDLEIFDQDTYTFEAIGNIPPSAAATSHAFFQSPDQVASGNSASETNGVTMGMAFTVSTTTTTGSYNGSSIVVKTGNDPGVPPDTLGIGFEGTHGAHYLTTYIVYAPQPDADLPALSTP